MGKDMEPNYAAILMNHINRGGDTHPIVDSKTDGFMSSSMLNSLSGFLTYRPWVSNVDINSLKPGLYEGSNLDNGPIGKQSVISEVEVTQGKDGRKMIRCTNNAWNVSWNKTVHTDGSTIGWAREYKEVVLWAGTSNLSQPVKFDYSVYDPNSQNFHFRQIKIIYQYGKNLNTCLSYRNPRDGELVFSANTMKNNSSISFCNLGITIAKDGLSASLSSFQEVTIGKGTFDVVTKNDNRIYVKQIIGIV